MGASPLPLFVLLAGALMAGCGPTPATLSPPALLDQIQAQERLGLEALKTGDLTAFAHSTADDAVFIDPHGLASKAEVMKNVAGFRLTDFSMQDVKLVATSADSGLIAYTLIEKGASHGHEFSAKAYVSSLWSKQNGEWRCRFSQETAARK